MIPLCLGKCWPEPARTCGMPRVLKHPICSCSYLSQYPTTAPTKPQAHSRLASGPHATKPSAATKTIADTPIAAHVRMRSMLCAASEDSGGVTDSFSEELKLRADVRKPILHRSALEQVFSLLERQVALLHHR